MGIMLWDPPHCSINTLRPIQNGRHSPDDIFSSIFLNEKVWTLIKISLKFVPKGPIDNIPALVQIMAWRRLGDKPLSEPMIVRLPTLICVTWSQWVNCTLFIVGSNPTWLQLFLPEKLFCSSKTSVCQLKIDTAAPAFNMWIIHFTNKSINIFFKVAEANGH